MLFQTHGHIATDDHGNSFRLMYKINTEPLAWAKLLELSFKVYVLFKRKTYLIFRRLSTRPNTNNSVIQQC